MLLVRVAAVLALVAAASALRYTDENAPCAHFFGTGNGPSHVVSPLPQDTIATEDVPSAFDWRNVDGANMVTVTRNQHLPVYCGSCWAFATTSAMSDRIKIAKKGVWPEVNLAPQFLLNCADAGTCHGGWPSKAYEEMAKRGITDETCAPYVAKDGSCDAIHTCMDCPGFGHGPCHPKEEHFTYYVAEHGDISGEDAMKKEIMARGPISCGVGVTPEFEAYTGGIFSQKDFPGLNHAISVVGWGVEDGKQFWIGRNSWGTYWGEQGWFRIEVGAGDLGITQDCSWATPKTPIP